MKPEQIAAPNTEHSHQAALFCWAGSVMDKYPEIEWMYAVPNGGERNKIVAAKMKAEGVKRGISDICLPFARHGYHSFYIEMKKPGNIKGETDDQKKFGAFLTETGFLYACFDHWEQARDAILWYLESSNEVA